MMQTKRQKLNLFFSCSILFLAAAAFTLFLKEYHYFSSGNDTWGHLFKSDLLYQSMKEGNFYPLYTNLWYNGLQPYRYWAPLPYYLLAGLQFLAGGSVEGAYYLFAGVSIFVGGFGWLLWGYRTNRISFCTFAALLWFFLPENIRVYFCEGNVPRMTTAIIIPYLLYFIWLFIRKKKNYAMPLLMLCMSGIVLSHVMISAMMGIGTFLFLLFDVFSSKEYLRSFQVLAGMLLCYALTGIWLIPALSGGLMGMDSGATLSVMETMTSTVRDSVNALNRLVGTIDVVYYGLSIAVISILGILLSPKGKKAGYITFLTILVLTTPQAVVFLSKLPLSQLFWMQRFATIAYAYFLWSLIEWKSIRRYFLILLGVFLLVDCLPSFMISRYYTQTSGRLNDEIKLTKEITDQRTVLMDLSSYASYPSWELCTGEDKIPYTFGWAWQGAVTAPNIVMLNTALEKEAYSYLFDRCLELGNDTVLIKKGQIGENGKSKLDVLENAQKSGYQLYKETNDTLLFKLEVPKTFGIKTEYEGIAIGSRAGVITLDYPKIEEGDSDYLDEYTFEELSHYKIIYLSGFQYHSRKAAEELAERLAGHGVKVVLDMSAIPADSLNHRMYFLDVYAQYITLEKRFPTLKYRGQPVETLDFAEEYSVWNTLYVDGTEKLLGEAEYAGQNLNFLGTKENGNLIFLGFNLFFHASETNDGNVFGILDDLLGMERNSIPKREIIPIQIEASADGMKILSPVEGINTTLAYQDIFVSDQLIRNKNHLLYIQEKNTEIKYVYPMLWKGMAVSIAGILFTVAFLFWLKFGQNKKALNQGAGLRENLFIGPIKEG